MVLLSVMAAFIISLLSGLGVGGGGLFLVYLTLFEGTPQLEAQGVNLLFFLFSAGASLPVHLLRRKIFTFALGIMIISGVAGALIGSYLSGVIDESILRKIFGAMLTVAGLFSLKKCVRFLKRPHTADK